MTKKLVILGLDGVPWRILNKMIEEGATPNLKRLKDEGSWGEFKTTIPPLTPPAWASIQTGVNPGKHGVYSFTGVDKRSSRGGEPSTVNADDIEATTLPEYLENSGFKAVLINLPLTHPPKTDFPTVGSIFSSKKVTPSDLKEKYDFSEYDISVPEMTDTNVLSNLKKIHKHVESNFPIIKEIFMNEDWDLFFYLFSQTDWSLHQAGEEFFLDEKGKKYDWVKKIYGKIDEKIGWFLKRAEENSEEEINFLLMSDHGFDHYEKQLSPAKKLKYEGLIKVKPKTTRWDENNSLQDNFLSNLFRLGLRSDRIADFLEYRYPWFCNRNREQIKEESEVFAGDPKFPSFFVNDERFFGKVDDKEASKEKVKNVLKSFEPEIKVHEREDIYWGDSLEKGPEFVLMPNKYLPKMFLINRELVSGEFQHSTDGMITGYGPDMKDGELDGATVYDITPTILHYFDIPLSKDFDGEVLSEMFKKASDLDREPSYTEKREEEKIKEKISGLDL